MDNEDAESTLEERKRMSMFYGSPLSIKTRAWRTVFSRPLFSMFTLMASAIMLTQVYFRAEDYFLHNMDCGCDMINKNFSAMMSSAEIVERTLLKAEIQALRVANANFVNTLGLVMNLSKHYVISHIENYYKAPMCFATTMTGIVGSNMTQDFSHITHSIASLTSAIGEGIKNIFTPRNSSAPTKGTRQSRRNYGPSTTAGDTQEVVNGTIYRDNISFDYEGKDVIASEIDKRMKVVIGAFMEDIKEGSDQVDSKIYDIFEKNDFDDFTEKKIEYKICDLKLSENTIQKIKNCTRPIVYFGVCIVPICAFGMILTNLCNTIIERKKAEEKAKLFCKALEVSTTKYTKISSLEKRSLTIDDARDLIMYAKHPKIWVCANIFWRKVIERTQDPRKRENIRWTVMSAIHLPGILCSIIGLIGISSAEVQIYTMDHSRDILYSLSEYIWNVTNSEISSRAVNVVKSINLNTQKFDDMRLNLKDMRKQANQIYKDILEEHKERLVKVYKIAEYNVQEIASMLPMEISYIGDPINKYLSCLFSSKIRTIEQIQMHVEGGVPYTPGELIQNRDIFDSRKMEVTVSQQTEAIFQRLLIKSNVTLSPVVRTMSPVTQGLATFLESYRQSLINSILMNVILVLFGMTVPIISILSLIVSLSFDRYKRKKVNNSCYYNTQSSLMSPKNNESLFNKKKYNGTDRELTYTYSVSYS